jgi:adenylate cyclase class 2
MSDENVESELKIPVADLEQVRASLQRARAVLARTMAREINLLLDTDDDRLRTAGCVLRLRRHAEHETEIGDEERMGRIFEELGFSVFMRYEKDREEWLLEEVSVVLDRTPMGSFVEVEGPPQKLAEIVDLLGVKIDSAVRGSYASLWLEHRARHPELELPFDMVFTE